jgi:uncharacterized protein YndB with AHSA1/START domain
MSAAPHTPDTPDAPEGPSDILNRRHIAAPPQAVFAAFAAERLARWWGPAGFRSTFHQYEFRNGGRWKLTLHAPDGAEYPNESTFAQVREPSLVVVRHDGAPHGFTLRIDLQPDGAGTAVTWRQRFDSVQERDKVVGACRGFNEQNLDRLQAEVAAGAP